MAKEYDKFVERAKNFFDNNPTVTKELLYLYNKGDNDRYITKKLNKKFGLDLVEKYIVVWRKLNNLPPNRTFGKKSCEIDERVGAKIIELNDLGLSNIEIASKLHISYNKVQKWRLEHGVYSKSKNLKLSEDKYRNELYQSGMTDKQIAEVTKRAVRTIQEWRQKRGFPPNKKEKKINLSEDI